MTGKQDNIVRKLTNIAFSGGRKWLIVMLCLDSLGAAAQPAKKDLPTAGIQVRTLFPSTMFTNSPTTQESAGRKFEITPHTGFSLGASIRQNVGRMFYFESGIHYVRREYQTHYTASNGRQDVNGFSLVNYEIPLMGGIYIRLDRKIYLQTAFGLSADMMPNNLLLAKDSIYEQSVLRRSWVLPGMKAAVGVEYRTKKNGILYVGGGYHRMLMAVGSSYYRFQDENKDEKVLPISLQGHYFSIDLKYFFPNQRTAAIEYD